jgi:hypothetical protein
LKSELRKLHLALIPSLHEHNLISTVDGNWFCQPVTEITYCNVGSPGSYNDITNMPSDGSCSSTPYAFAGPIAPLDEEVNAPYPQRTNPPKLTGLLTDLNALPCPVQLKQFAAYAPVVSTAKKREASPAQIYHYGHQHDAFHKRSNSKNRFHDKRRHQEVTATIDGEVVSSENDWFNETTTPSTTVSTASTAPIQWVAATIDRKIVSWLNNWFGDSVATPVATATMTSPAQMITATIDGQAVSWPNYWFGGAPMPTSTSESASAPTVGGPATGENAALLLKFQEGSDYC